MQDTNDTSAPEQAEGNSKVTVPDTVRNAVRGVVEATPSLGGTRIEDGGNLFDAGLTSLDLVSLALRLEETFDIRVPDELMVRETFASIDSIVAMVRKVSAR